MGGFVVAGADGDGLLHARNQAGNQAGGHYRATPAGYDLQVGEETYGYALFFMTGAAPAAWQRTGDVQGAWATELPRRAPRNAKSPA